MAHCRVLLCNINKKSDSQDSGFLSISNKDLVTFYFPLAIFLKFLLNSIFAKITRYFPAAANRKSP